MIVHWQTLYGGRLFLCGEQRAGMAEGHSGRCLDSGCAMCEGGRDAVNCPACIMAASTIVENLEYWHRADGPHPKK